MEIAINTEKANLASMQLLDLSRMVRRSREEIAGVQRQLRQMTELDECILALRRQEEALSLLAGQLVNMSSALREISGAYTAVEERSSERLEERPLAGSPAGEAVIYDGSLRQRIHNILYH